MADISQSILRRLRDLYNNPRASMEQVVDNLRNSSRGQVAEARPSGLGMRGLSMPERARGTTQAALDNLGGGGLGIIKQKGGNWLTGSVEGALGVLKRTNWPNPNDLIDPAVVSAVKQQFALNNWIEGPLAKYVKRDMATEGDPVRKLAEQGVLHYNPEVPPGTPSDLIGLRRNLGMPDFGVAKSQLARNWENLSDAQVIPYKARMVNKDPTTLKENEWLGKIDPEATVYDIEQGLGAHRGELGFQHLTDELSNSLNPESGLPRQLLLTPEQMQQMGMEKAVRHVDAINKWRAAQQAEANLAMSQSPAVHNVREYAENNPKGLRWVEVNMPTRFKGDAHLKELEALPPGPERIAAAEALNKERQLAEAHLEEQLKYEGDTMGHCVGGYCDDVTSGKSRIFSLRDAKGEPHVTIETALKYGLGEEVIDDSTIAALGRGHPLKKAWKRYNKDIEAQDGNPIDYDDFGGYLFVNEPELRSSYTQAFSPPQSIVQIKGKANKKPNDEYLSFVQDFVKNHPEGGAWGEVGDLQNTGLIKSNGQYITPEEGIAAGLANTPNNYANGGLIPNNVDNWEQIGTGYLLR